MFTPIEPDPSAARRLVSRQRARNDMVLAAIVAAALAFDGFVLVVGRYWSERLSIIVAVTCLLLLIEGVFAVVRPSSVDLASARELSANEMWMQHSVDRLADSYWIQAPRVKVVEESAVNACTFGSGRGTAIGVTRGLLDLVSDSPAAKTLWESITARQLAQIAACDRRVTMVSAAVFWWPRVAGHMLELLEEQSNSVLNSARARVGATGGVISHVVVSGGRAGSWLLFRIPRLLLAGLPDLIHDGLSRQRNDADDLIAAVMTGRPGDLAELLRKVSAADTRVRRGRRVAPDTCLLGEKDDGRSHSLASVRIENLERLGSGTKSPALGRFPLGVAASFAALTTCCIAISTVVVAAPGGSVAGDLGYAADDLGAINASGLPVAAATPPVLDLASAFAAMVSSRSPSPSPSRPATSPSPQATEVATEPPRTSPPPAPAPVGPPVFESPASGATVNLAEALTVRVQPVEGSTGYLFGFFQRGEMVWENGRDEGRLSGPEYLIKPGDAAHAHLGGGSLEIWARASVNGRWSDAGIITITLN